VFANNLPEVMQFVFDHTTFDTDNAMDQGALEAYKPLGVESGNAFDAAKVTKLDGVLFREVAAEVAKWALTSQANPVFLARVMPQMFMPKGQIDRETEVAQSVIGPIGQPGPAISRLRPRTGSRWTNYTTMCCG
jgi:hypothetical protein